ncbi:hypothetical protein HHL19_13935 [Streptomyces sp. R302]|uniref:hypothetical protein n=1 Tax=unclassified Streptomyces TaxID=2593676 RepID=UPI00145EC1F3|nr:MULTISPECIES: hypothetical protein [unclassified Streptomyces]NML51172.1 hypothetical protein [Streptomyces sp. R301]NML79750.1 hypothetical protein [Streptomyces sp. R302]
MFVSVLDGVALCTPRRRRLVDDDALLARADARPAHAPVLRLLAAIRRQDPALLRRVLLYQLLPLARQGATGLGLDPAELTLLAKASRALPDLDDRQRTAAEALAPLWSRRRLRACAHAVTALGPDVLRADPWLGSLDARLRRRLDRCDRDLAAAGTAAPADPAGAEAGYLRVLAVAADDDEAVRGLIRLGAVPATADAPLTARPVEGGRVALAWPARPGVRWRVLRDAPGPDRATPVPGAGGTASTAVDADPPVGLRVRYAAFPVEDGRPTGVPLVSHPLLVAPDAEGAVLEDGPARIAVRWRRPRTATATVLTLTGPDAPTLRHTVDRAEEHVFTDLEPGVYQLLLTARHSSPSGEPVDAPGVRRTVTVHPWPRPLTALTADAGPEEGVRFTGRGAEGAEVRLVVWPEGAAPAPGTELRTDALPAPLPWARYGAPGHTVPDTAFTGLVSAVTVLGERALAGPGVRLDVPGPVGAPRAAREPGGQVRLLFDWPSGAGAVTAAWPGGDLRISRSAYVREGLRLPVGPGPSRVTLRPLVPEAGDGYVGDGDARGGGRDAGAQTGVQTGAGAGTGADGTGGRAAGTGARGRTDRTVVAVRRAPVGVDVPGEAVVRYRLLTRRRGLRARVPYAVEVSVDGYDPAVPLPELVLVHQDAVRPRHAEDGTVLLRIDGAALARAPLQTLELPPVPDLSRPPYALRAFLLGDGAGAVRLEEPALTTLVVR